MKHPTLMEKTQKLLKCGSVFMLVLATAVCFRLLAADHANALYILTGAADSAIVLDGSASEDTVQDVSSQLIYLDTKARGFEITLQADKTVSVHYNGAIITVQSQEETISSLLSRLHIEPGPLEMVLVELSGSRVDLTIGSDLSYYDRSVESVAYETLRLSTPDLPMGTEEVVQPGVNGTRTAVYEVIYSGGEEISRQFVEEINCTAVDEIIHVGTGVDSVESSDRIADIAKNEDGSGVLTFRSGATMKFSDVKSMTGTAYTAGHGGADYTTATGSFVRVGVVAVDKRVIPLGTKMYIVTADGKVVYGVATAEDTGVRGNKVDLYYDTYQQCISFGRRACTVYLLDD